MRHREVHSPAVRTECALLFMHILVWSGLLHQPQWAAAMTLLEPGSGHV